MSGEHSVADVKSQTTAVRATPGRYLDWQSDNAPISDRFHGLYDNTASEDLGVRLTTSRQNSSNCALFHRAKSSPALIEKPSRATEPR